MNENKLSIYQSQLWEEFKLSTGYLKSFRVEGILILKKDLPFGFSMLYSPMVNKYQVESIKYKEFLEQIRNIAKQNNSIFYRLELDIPTSDKAFDFGFSTLDFKKGFEEMQPEHNWVLDLKGSTDSILAEMKQRGRYHIKQAQKNDLKITFSCQKGRELDAFYTNYSATGKRHKISYRSKEYFNSLIEILGSKEYARVYTVWKGKIPLASAIMVCFNKEAQYLYGGSSEKMRHLMAPYLIQWQMIQDAKELGCKTYNFLGVAPNDDVNHSWAGITRFKRGFGGHQRDIIGCYDLLTKPFIYKIFKLAEKLRRK